MNDGTPGADFIPEVFALEVASAHERAGADDVEGAHLAAFCEGVMFAHGHRVSLTWALESGRDYTHVRVVSPRGGYTILTVLGDGSLSTRAVNPDTALYPNTPEGWQCALTAVAGDREFWRWVASQRGV